MKKLFIICSILTLLTGCGNNKEKSIPIIYDDYGRDILPGEANYYYTFTGESKHFSFNNGIADYRGNKAEFEIKGLEQKKNEEFMAYINIYFNDKLFSFKMFNNELIKSNNTIAGVHGRKIKRDSNGNFQGEIDAFMETKPEDFENAIKIIANYCDSKNNCQDEEFELNINKHE